MRSLTLIVAAIAAVLGSLLISAPAQAASYGEIVSYGSDKCVDIRTQDNITVQEWRCSGADEQHFNVQLWFVDGSGLNVYRIIPKSNTQNCLTVGSPSLEAGTQLVSGFCDSRSSSLQLWHLRAHDIGGQTWYEVANYLSGYCMSLRAGSGANGTIVEQNSCTATPADLWRL